MELLARSLITQNGMIKLRHHSLIAWQRADDLFIKLHKLALQSFPPIERFELSSQLRRVAYSVAANIVEGYGRRKPKDRLKFLNIAEASLAEVSYCVHAAWRLGYISEQTRISLEDDLNGVGAPLVGLIRSVRISNAITTATVAIVCVTVFLVFV